MNLDDVAAALLPQDKPRDSHVYGRVESVNADGSYEVKLNASSVTARCSACCTASAGDRVLVVIKADGKCAAVGRVGGLIAPSELDELEALLGISSGGGCSMTDLMWDMANPVGSVRQFCTDFDPNDVRGEWKRIKGRFLLASSSSYEAGSAGGEAEHTLTVSEMPSHMHDPGNIYLYSHDNSGGNSAAGHRSVWTNTADKSYTVMNKTASTGGSQPHNNMPPYLAVDTWRRVA